MKTQLRRLGSLVAAAVLSVTLIVAGSQPAHASGPTIQLVYDHLQVGEMTLLFPDTGCPYALPGWDYVAVRGTFTDANNQVFTNVFLGDAKADGSWVSGTFFVPAGAALGVGSLAAYCLSTQNPLVDPNPTREFDPVSVTVVGQATGVTVDRTNIWHNAKFSSVTACDANATVNIQWHSPAHTFRIDPSVHEYNLEFTDAITSNSSGMWEYTIPLIPGQNVFTHVGQVYTFRAVCQNSSGPYEYGSYNVRLDGDQYVALGDSYSSGLGSYNYDLVGDDCYRSSDSYAHYLVDSMHLDPPNFRACAGDVTEDLFNNDWYFDPYDMPLNQVYRGQMGWLSDDTEVVTITIGGNDSGFAEVLTECADYFSHTGYGCKDDPSVIGPLNDRLYALSGQVVGTVYAPDGIKEVHSFAEVLYGIVSVAPNAKVYIAGYPHLFGESTAYWSHDTSAPGNYKCVVGSHLSIDIAYSFADARFLNEMTDRLNGAIQDVVNDMQSNNVIYVDPWTFSGHSLCDSDVSYVNGVTVTGVNTIQKESFHPTVTGMQEGYGVAFSMLMS